MITYTPDPVILHIWGFLAIRWYGILFFSSFILIWWLAKRKIKRKNNPVIDEKELVDLMFYALIGTIVGGRLGFMIFYNFHELINNPLTIFQVWHGGMSFHGGLLGSIGTLFLFAYRYKKSLSEICDFITPLIPIGLGIGRIANFLNGELWGRVTTYPWGIIYTNVDNNPRHPSQIYEFFMEGVILFLIINIYARKKRPAWAISGLFLSGYALFRFICEFFREPDSYMGFIYGNYLTMGQILSLPLLIIGIFLILITYLNEKNKS